MVAAALVLGCSTSNAQEAPGFIGKSDITLNSDLMTPEALWAMGRIGGHQASPDGKRIVYQVSYYSVKENKSHSVIYVMDANGKNNRMLTTSSKSESDAVWIAGGQKSHSFATAKYGKCTPTEVTANSLATTKPA